MSLSVFDAGRFLKEENLLIAPPKEDPLTVMPLFSCPIPLFVQPLRAHTVPCTPVCTPP